MPIVTFNEVGNGIIKDVSPNQLGPQGWTDGVNVRFNDNFVERILGEADILGTPTDHPFHLMPVSNQDLTFVLYSAASTYTDGVTEILDKVYVSDGSVQTDLTATAFTGNIDDRWHATVFSGIPVLNNGREAPQEWNFNVSTNLATLSNWQANTTCRVISSFKNFLVAIDVTKSGTRFPYRVKWSDSADPGSLPGSWDETDPTTLAGEVDLAETSDILVDQLPLRDTNIIYKEKTIWGMSFIGGQSVFRFFKLFSDQGLLAQQCVTEIEGRHFAVGFDDIYIHDGQSIQSVADRRIVRTFFNELDTTYYPRTTVVQNPDIHEVWICYPQNSSRLNRALIWNWRENTWTFRDLNNIRHITTGVLDTATGSWDSDPNSWDSDTTTWDQDALSATNIRIFQSIAETGTQKFLEADTGELFDTSIISSFLERRALPLAKAPADITTIKLIRQLWPRFEVSATTSLSIKVGSQMNLNDSPTWATSATFNPQVDEKVDVFATGRYMAIRIEHSATAGWKLTGYDVDADIEGRY